MRHLGIPNPRWKDNIKINLKESEWGTWTGFMWLRIGMSAGLL